MPSASFEFQPGKMQSALEYVSECFKWLAAEDDRLYRAVHELDIDKVMETTKNLLHNICCIRNRLAPINRLPPELLGAIFEHLTESRSRLVFNMDYKKPRWYQCRSVCRHWRYTAINTPALWSYIHISIAHSVPLESECAVASTSLIRSGVGPLDVYLRDDCCEEFIGKPLMEGLVSNSGRIRELCIESDEIPYLDALLQEAGQLETLAIAVPESGANKEYLGSIDSWRVPQLRTLFARAFTGWQRGRFSTLRHLILDYPEWDDCALRGLYALLSSNPRIEDLVLIHNSSRDNREEPLKGLPPVNLPYLERIVANNTVNGDGHCTAAQIFEKILLPEEVHATVYEFRYKLLPEDYFAPLQKLYLHKSSHAVTTDGRTSYYLKGAVRVYVKHCVEAAQSRPLQVRELWLWSYSPVAGLPPLYSLAIKEWMHGLRVMAEVKKLVLLHDIKAWLQFITQKRLLPSLTELQLHSQEHEHEPAISRFLEERAQSNPIQVLRFVQDPEAGGKVEAFSHWKERSQFSNLARRVVFEDPSDGPLRMELPPICTTESTVHSYWPSWESTMYNYVAQDRKTVYVYS